MKPAPQPDPPGTAARRGALRLLLAVLGRGQSLEASLDGALSDLALPQDRALARNLATTVLRWSVDFDRIIDAATPKPLPDDARARHVLRIALAGLLVLKTPPHAVVSTALPLVESGPRRLVHAVLSRLQREAVALPPHPSLPDLFAVRWANDWGEAVADAAAWALGDEPATDLTLKDAGDTAHWAAALGGTSLAPGHVRVARGSHAGPLVEWPGFAEGAWWVQDFAASLPARLLGSRSGERVLDLCAAPGGKTLQLAASGAAVTALDIAAPRLDRVRENLARTGLTATLIAADALAWAPDAPFDRILLDAPCSATGIYRRHPDVLHLKGARDLRPLLELQKALLARALTWLQPGGTLVYATCSLDRREGETQVTGMTLDPIGAAELPGRLVRDTSGLGPDTAGPVGGRCGARWLLHRAPPSLIVLQYREPALLVREAGAEPGVSPGQAARAVFVRNAAAPLPARPPPC